MIAINYDPATGIARVAQALNIMTGADVPVRLTFASAPGEVSSLQLGLGSQADAPETLAFTEDFDAESERVWTALLDTTDERLIEALDGKASLPVNVELVTVIDGVRRVAPHFGATVRKSFLGIPETSEGGPTYLTEAQVTAAIAAATPRVVTMAIPNAAESVTVNFSPAFGAVPVVVAVVIKADPGDADLSVVGVHTVTTGAATVVLSAPAPTGNYVLNLFAKTL